MPELVEQMYCSQQITIPPKFPYILKRYCKAAIKTQPYDLLRWSFEYFKALMERRAPPVKLRLEYPVYSTEGGLTRGCLKVLHNQLGAGDNVTLPLVRSCWQGFCLDNEELRRILCCCEVYMRSDVVPRLHFIAVAAGLLTKSLTHTMILLCETLTKEPDGGSAAIPLSDFLKMYRFLAIMDCSQNVKYNNGYREGETPQEEVAEEMEEEAEADVESYDKSSMDDFWSDIEKDDLHKLSLINDHVARSARVSKRMTMPTIGKIERSPSIERAGQIERENYMRERKGRREIDKEYEKRMQESMAMLEQKPSEDVNAMPAPRTGQPNDVLIVIVDENDTEIPLEIYNEAKVDEDNSEQENSEGSKPAQAFDISELLQIRRTRRYELWQAIQEIASIVSKFKSANYDLGMVAGRQMSTTSGEFIVQSIEREVLEYIDEQIAVLPDPDLKKKKAKPEEVAMIKMLINDYLDETMEIIVPEVEEVEEEEQAIPEITQVYAIPGIGPPVPEDIVREFEEYLQESCAVQADMVMPRNIRHFMCPPLEQYVEYDYIEFEKRKEEIPTAGAIE